MEARRTPYVVNANSTEPVVHLMYHEIQVPGRIILNPDPGYTRYIISSGVFREQMRWLRSIDWRAMSVSEGLKFPHGPGVVATFDDGSESDLLAAAPLLQEAGFSATFYVTVGLLGKRNYLSQGQVCELRRQGFEIGCHSMTHAYLDDLSAEQLDSEIVGAKILLEDILGEHVDHFSCPGGRWNARVAKIAKQAGFRSVTTSAVGANSRQANLYRLNRVPIKSQTTMNEFRAICKGQGLWQLRFRDLTLVGIRKILGNTHYDRFRSFLLQSSKPFSRERR